MLTAAVVAACATASSLQAGAHVVFVCIADGLPCKHPEQCCGYDCRDHVCEQLPRDGGCVENNYACSSASDCCTGDCDPDGFCGLPACVTDGMSCKNDGQCCGHVCSPRGICVAPDAGACTEDYNPCGIGVPSCCSGAAGCGDAGFCGPLDAPPRCKDDLISCSSHADCCSSYCNPGTALCGFPQNATNCLTVNSACDGGECCSGVCDPAQGICDPFVCVENGGACDAGGECCSQLRCAGGSCRGCITNGNACQQDLDCCSTICSHGSCSRT